jgi:lysophospholipase L1-like esterase
LWRLENGELDDVNPKVIVLLAGTNNVGDRVGDVTGGFAAVLRVMRAKAPNAVIIPMGIFPRYANMVVMPKIDAINANLATMADGRGIRYLNINGRLYDRLLNAKDKLHPTVQGYKVWADALKPFLTELLGPPATEDHAPPPTGDPSAR